MCTTDSLDGLQASVALACPTTQACDSIDIKETTNDSSQHIESANADGTTMSVPLHLEIEATREPSSFTFDVCPSSAPYEGKVSGSFLSFPSIQVDKTHIDPFPV